jgi:catechol-2,3-dioxygenase
MNNNININDHKWMLLAKGTVIGYHHMRLNAQLKACTFYSELGYNYRSIGNLHTWKEICKVVILLHFEHF